MTRCAWAAYGIYPWVRGLLGETGRGTCSGGGRSMLSMHYYVRSGDGVGLGVLSVEAS